MLHQRARRRPGRGPEIGKIDASNVRLLDLVGRRCCPPPVMVHRLRSTIVLRDQSKMRQQMARPTPNRETKEALESGHTVMSERNAFSL